ncbi:porin [Roseateles sp. DAIF2]|uniref:porin n=1 Tax=Roseateles sp. DAIF2 TaxID=2714952 RepID=UPI0018A2E724|nr:porin [Roseateles sp. DAIF2]QPF75187.1 porin [Roseateles sp. DAIF2]
MNPIKNKKLLIASTLLGLACAAQAQSTGSKVTLYGLIDLSVGSGKNPGGSAIKNVDSGKLSTSYFGLSGSEELGDGLSAFFTLDSFLRADVGNNGRFNGDNFWARNAFVGLSHKDLGLVRLGRNTTPLFVQTLAFNAFGDSFGYSPSIRQYFSAGATISGTTATGDTGWSDSVQYLSPKFGGFSFGAIVAAGEGAGGKNYGVNAGYAAGAFAASFNYQNVKKDGAAPVADSKTWQGAASYDLGAAKLFGQYGKVENSSNGRDYKITGLGAAVPVGDGKLLAQYGRMSASAGPDRKTLTVGYDHYLSKRTDVYAVAMSDKLDGLSGGSSYSLGIRHRF